MIVPKYIRNKMKNVVKYSHLMSREMNQVEDWLITHGYDVDKLRSGDGESLEELEYGSDVVDLICKKIENNFGKIE